MTDADDKSMVVHPSKRRRRDAGAVIVDDALPVVTDTLPTTHAASVGRSPYDTHTEPTVATVAAAKPYPTLGRLARLPSTLLRVVLDWIDAVDLLQLRTASKGWCNRFADSPIWKNAWFSCQTSKAIECVGRVFGPMLQHAYSIDLLFSSSAHIEKQLRVATPTLRRLTLTAAYHACSQAITSMEFPMLEYLRLDNALLYQDKMDPDDVGVPSFPRLRTLVLDRRSDLHDVVGKPLNTKIPDTPMLTELDMSNCIESRFEPRRTDTLRVLRVNAEHGLPSWFAKSWPALETLDIRLNNRTHTAPLVSAIHGFSAPLLRELVIRDLHDQYWSRGDDVRTFVPHAWLDALLAIVPTLQRLCILGVPTHGHALDVHVKALPPTCVALTLDNVDLKILEPVSVNVLRELDIRGVGTAPLVEHEDKKDNEVRILKPEKLSQLRCECVSSAAYAAHDPSALENISFSAPCKRMAARMICEDCVTALMEWKSIMPPDKWDNVRKRWLETFDPIFVSSLRVLLSDV